MKQCTKCKQWKEETEFYKDKSKKDELDNKCKICIHNYSRQYYKKNRKHILELYHKDLKEKNKKYKIKYDAEFRWRRKQYIFFIYSNGEMKCQICGDEEMGYKGKFHDNLSIDHINGNGKEHRKELNGHDFYYWLSKNNFPDDYTVLCRRCNMGKQDNSPKEFAKYIIDCYPWANNFLGEVK